MIINLPVMKQVIVIIMVIVKNKYQNIFKNVTVMKVFIFIY